MKPLLQTLGLLALLAFTGAGVAAWTATKDHVRVVVSDDAGEGPDPFALLDDRMAALEGDVVALAGTLGANFELLDGRVAAALDVPAREAAADAARVERELRARVAELEARLGVLEAAAGRPAASVAAGPSEPPAAEPPTAEPPATESPAADPAPAGAAAPAAAPSFLAFELPSRDFEVALRRTWTVVPALSRVGFDGSSTLHDFSGATSGVTGSFAVDPTRPADAPTGRIVVDARSLDTGNDSRDATMHEHLASDRFPTFEFALEGYELDGDAGPDGASAGTVRGRLSIHGTERGFAMPVRIGLDDSRRLLVEGSAPLRLSDFGVEAPSQLGIVEMADEVTLWIALRARPGAELR